MSDPTGHPDLSAGSGQRIRAAAVADELRDIATRCRAVVAELDPDSLYLISETQTRELLERATTLTRETVRVLAMITRACPYREHTTTWSTLAADIRDLLTEHDPI